MSKHSDVPEFGERIEGQNYLPRPGAYGLIFDAEGRIAVLDTPRGSYLPGGGSEGSETPEETLVREAREECGFVVAFLIRVGEAVEYVYTEGNDAGIRKECVFFMVRLGAEGGLATEADHVLTWLEPQEAQIRLAHGSQQWAVAQALAAVVKSLSFDALPALPQVAILQRIAVTLWQREDVVALWLGGSFARGEADEYSDLDLRVAVLGEDVASWSSFNLSILIGEKVVGGLSRNWDRTVLHHLVLADGVILDLLVQSASKEPPQDFTYVLGCREAAFGASLAQAKLPLTEQPGFADPSAIRQAVTDFWIGTHKHARMLHRGLDLLVLIGLGLEHPVLMRLWYAEETGQDQTTQRETIHTLTPSVRAVTGAIGAHSLETLGTPRRSRAEILRAIEGNRDEVARVGRRLAERLGFEYPEALEQTVREGWREYLKRAASADTDRVQNGENTKENPCRAT